MNQLWCFKFEKSEGPKDFFIFKSFSILADYYYLCLLSASWYCSHGPLKTLVISCLRCTIAATFMPCFQLLQLSFLVIIMNYSAIKWITLRASCFFSVCVSYPTFKRLVKTRLRSYSSCANSCLFCLHPAASYCFTNWFLLPSSSSFWRCIQLLPRTQWRCVFNVSYVVWDIATVLLSAPISSDTNSFRLVLKSRQDLNGSLAVFESFSHSTINCTLRIWVHEVRKKFWHHW